MKETKKGIHEDRLEVHGLGCVFMCVCVYVCLCVCVTAFRFSV